MAVPIQVLHNSSGVVYYLDMTRNGFIQLEPQSSWYGIPFKYIVCVDSRKSPPLWNIYSSVEERLLESDRSIVLSLHAGHILSFLLNQPDQKY